MCDLTCTLKWDIVSFSLQIFCLKQINKVVGCSVKQEIKHVIANKNTKSPQINVLISQSNIILRTNKATCFS